MELHQNKAALDGTHPELERPTYRQLHADFQRKLREIATRKVIQTHVRGALRALDALLSQMGDGTNHQHWKRGISPESANATRAALELIREQTVYVERAISRAENRWLELHLEQKAARHQRANGDAE